MLYSVYWNEIHSGNNNIPGGRILFSTPKQLRKQKYAIEPAQLVLSLKLQSDQHSQMIPYNC